MACTDVQTIQAGNGSKTQFSFDFPYIFKSEIHVYFWNVTTKEYDEKLTTDSTYPWRITDANPTIVEFTGTAPPSPTSPTDPGEPTVDNVKIRRITKVDDIRALFNPGSAIRSDDLNKNFEQLRYAIQEANCAGIPDDVDAYLKNYYWNKFDETVYSTETWDSDNDQVATTQATDARIDAKIDAALTGDVAGADGISITDNSPGSGQITIGLTDNSVDFDKIKDADQIKLADQTADYDNGGSDDKVFTSVAAIRRFENFVQDATPTTTAGIGKGRVWVDIADDKTLSVWDGTNWVAITSGGTFTNQPKVVYVDATAGNDSNDGHRISRPKKTIKAAVAQINSDATYGDGSVVVVAPGVYQEACPIDITKANVSIIGTALRSCIIHPTVATENSVMFRVNSGSFLQNLTFTGMKAGTGTGNSADATLPSTQGWNVAFYPGCTITKSPYIQNCTNFSDSEINNASINVITPAGGGAGDNDSAPTGGGLLVDGSVPSTTSPLRSIVADSYTHVGLNGPGILVTNNGYAQCTSSYAFFNKYHIKCLNGGQANLAASTTDFGDQALVADGKSTAAIFTSNVDGAASSGALTFNINQPTAGTGWFGDANRPASNMLVTVNSVTYPILSATARTDSEGGSGWTVKISRPNPNNRSNNLGLNGAVADNLAVQFFLRSQIASSGHTMEYVGSGTDYRALPENGGVPDDTKQITESNGGKIWTATTDHNGKFKIGGNQTDDPFFEVDQEAGFVTIPEGSIAFNLLSDVTPQLGGNLDVNSNTITGLPTTPSATTEATSKAYVDTKLPLAGGTLTGALTLSGAPSSNLHAATKAYVDTEVANVVDSAPATLDTLNELAAALNDDANFSTTVTNSIATKMPLAGGTFTGNVDLDDNVKVRFGTGDDLEIFHNGSNTKIINGTGRIDIETGTGNIDLLGKDGTEAMAKFIPDGAVELYHDNSKKFETKSDGIDVTGEVQCDSLDVDGAASLSSGGFALDSSGVIQTNVQSAGHIELDSTGSFSSPKIKLFSNTGNAQFAGTITAQANAVAEIGTLTSGTTITPDFATHCNFTVTLGTNATIANPSNLVAGQSGSIFFVQDGTGSRTASWGSYWDFAGGSPTDLTTTAGAVDRVDYIVRSSTSIHAVFTLNVS